MFLNEVELGDNDIALILRAEKNFVLVAQKEIFKQEMKYVCNTISSKCRHILLRSLEFM